MITVGDINKLNIKIKVVQSFVCYLVYKGYQCGSQGKSHQNVNYVKQAMRKSCLPTGLKPEAFGLPIHHSTSNLVGR